MCTLLWLYALLVYLCVCLYVCDDDWERRHKGESSSGDLILSKTDLSGRQGKIVEKIYREAVEKETWKRNRGEKKRSKLLNIKDMKWARCTKMCYFNQFIGFRLTLNLCNKNCFLYVKCATFQHPWLNEVSVLKIWIMFELFYCFSFSVSFPKFMSNGIHLIIEWISRWDRVNMTVCLGLWTAVLLLELGIRASAIRPFPIYSDNCF